VKISNVILRRIGITFALFAAPFVGGLLVTYEVIQIDWLSMMEVQPHFRPMEAPLPVPEGSIPIDGAAYIGGIGSPENPIPADADSIERGRILFDDHCKVCHGAVGLGDGTMSLYLKTVPPENLTGETVSAFTDGDIFLTITNGVMPYMPPMGENLDVRGRWDVVNYVRTLQGE
jgi:mono/diheme cytochrome c family protein